MFIRAKRIAVVAIIGIGIAFGATLCASAQEASATQVPHMEADPSAGLLDTGFHRLYGLNFKGASADFAAYQKARPDDPMGKAAEAASYLFEEFNTKGVLTSAFFLDDAKFLGGVDGNLSQNRNTAFLDANHQARELAKRQVKSNPRDADGLLVLTISNGMESNYKAIIEKNNSLHSV